MGTFGNTFGNTLGTPRVASGEVPTITDIVVSDITDTGFTVTANVDPMGDNTVVTILYGETNSYGQTQETVTGSPLVVAGSISAVISNLTPYTTYHFSIRAVNSTGTTNSLDMTQATATPPEITDVNHFGRYIFNSTQNIVSSDQFTRGLMDILHYAVTDTDMYGGGGTFDSATGWSVNAGTWQITGGKLIGLNGGSTNLVRSLPNAIVNAVYRTQFTIDSISTSWIRPIQLYPQTTRSSPGTYQDDLIAMGTYVGLNKNTTTTGQFDNLTGYRITGRHLVCSVLANIPSLKSTYLEFDGSNDIMQNAVDATATVGTIFIVGQRVGTDSNFAVFNSLDGFGEYSGNQLTIGRQSGVYKNIRIKEIFIASTVFDAGTINRINAYYNQMLSQDGYQAPLGKTSSPATNASARQFIVSICDDDATEYLWQQDTSSQADYPYCGGFYTRFHPVFVAANRYLLANNLIQPGEEIAPCECTYLDGRLSTNPDQGAYYYRGYHLKMLQDVYGWEIASHSKRHGEFINALHDEALAEEEINDTRNILQNTYGLNIDTFVYPVGYHSHLTRLKVLENHKVGIAVGGTFAVVTNHNNPPINHAAISRKTIDLQANCDASGNVINPTTTLNLLKSYINETRDAKGWLVTMSHCGAYFWKNYNSLFIDPTYPSEWIIPVSTAPNPYNGSPNHVLPEGWYPYPNSLLDCLYKTIIYIYEQGGKIVLPRDGIDIYGNISTTGDPTWGVVGIGATQDDLYYNHIAKGVDGSITAYRSS